MAGFGDQPAPRRAVDWRATDPGARLWPRRENSAGNRRALKLQQPSSEGLQGGASHRQGRSSEAGAWKRGDDRQGHKALPAEAGGGAYAACGRGKGGRGDLSGDSNPAIDAGVDQHRLHRAPAGHLPGPAGSSGASDPRRSTQALYARSGDVAGWQLLQPLVGASLSWRGAHPGDGSRAYRSSLVDGGVVDVCGATRRSAQMAWAKAEVAAGGRGCSLTTVPCALPSPRESSANCHIEDGAGDAVDTLRRLLRTSLSSFAASLPTEVPSKPP